MAATKLVEEEGTLLEHALRRIKLGRAESALGMRWVEGKASHSDIGRVVAFRWEAEGGAYEMVELAEAAVVVNPIARQLVAALAASGVRLDWVQETLVKEGAGVTEGVSVDLVLSVAGLGGRRDYWWVELKWTRGDHNREDLRVVREGREKVADLEKVVKKVKEWRLGLGGHPVFRPQRVGLMVVSPRGWRLNLNGGGIPARGGSFGGGGDAEGGESGVEDGGENGGGIGGNSEDGGDEGTEDEEADGGEDEEDLRGGAVEQHVAGMVVRRVRRYVRRPIKTDAQVDAEKRYRETDDGYEGVLEERLARRGGGKGGGGSGGAGGDEGGGDDGGGGEGGGGGRGGCRIGTRRSSGAGLVEGVTKIGRKRKRAGET